jgi:hypothetical protein
MGDMRLEVFRRINQGGTPLSGQDIRLAYYGSQSPSLALIRLVGVYNPEKPAAKRFLERARSDFQMEYPWKNDNARQCWDDWWADKEIARGQTASEAFLWSVITAQVEKLDNILQNSSALQVLGCRFNRAVDEALDACCAQFRYQDRNTDTPAALIPYPEMRNNFFPYFEECIGFFLGRKGPNLPVTKHRILSSVVGAMYALSVTPSKLSEQQWTDLVEFIRRPQDLAKRFEVEYPQSKGRWHGLKGYKAQLVAVKEIVGKIVS